MNQYKYVFGITRVPLPECDKLAGSFPPKSTHAIVLVRDQVYSIELYKNGKRFAPAEIKKYHHIFIN
jgi:carnitine O-acetyltransferase